MAWPDWAPKGWFLSNPVYGIRRMISDSTKKIFFNNSVILIEFCLLIPNIGPKRSSRSLKVALGRLKFHNHTKVSYMTHVIIDHRVPSSSNQKTGLVRFWYHPRYTLCRWLSIRTPRRENSHESILLGFSFTFVSFSLNIVNYLHVRFDLRKTWSSQCSFSEEK